MIALAGRGVAAATLAAALLALCGCGPVRHSSRSGPAAGADAATGQRLQRELLTTGELPLGFERQDGAEAAAIGCAGIDRLYLAGGTSARATVSFGHSISDTLVNETILVQPGAAAANVEAFRRAASECRTFNAQQTSYRVGPLAGIPTVGDATAGLRITAGLRESRPVDLVAARLGDTVVLIANASGRVDTDLTRTLLLRAVDKVRRAGR